VTYEGFVEPAYGSRSLSDVLPAVARALGVDENLLGSPELVLPEAASYVVFLIDGLGAELLRRYAHAAPYLSSLLSPNAVGTAGVPSTTATSLSSLGTALPPGGHGLVGFSARIPGTDRLLNHLQWDSSIDPVEWQPHPTAFARMSRAGVIVTSVNKRQFANSGLTMASQRGADYVGVDGAGERIAAVIDSTRWDPSLTYVYDSDLDWTGHKFGVASSQWLQQLALIDSQAEQLREALPPSTRLALVADHGMVDCDRRIDIDDNRALRDGVTLLGGEARFRHIYCAPGAIDDVVATWRETLGEAAQVVRREDAVAEGWFGPVDPGVMPRLGDVMAVTTGGTGLFSSVDFSYETTLVGLHGSMTADEMLIPILVD
jgi:hypothetical protein